MTEKRCFKCGVIKNISEYYSHKQMLDGHLNKCKECAKSESNKNRQGKKEYYQKYDRDRKHEPSRIETRNRYISSDKGKEKVKCAHQKYISKFPGKRKAHILIANRIRDGSIKRPIRCENCLMECHPQAHHCDYTKPLDVMWLCQPCHVEWHKNNTPIYGEMAA